jgi:hypothetical protein
MHLRKQGGMALRFLSSLAGLQAGVLGGVLVIVWLAVAAAWGPQPWWAHLNLLGSTFYGEAAFERGFGRITLAGAAFQIVIAGVYGLLYGLLTPEFRSRWRAMLFGIAAGVALYYILNDYLWRRTSPWVVLYAPGRIMVLAYFFYGFILGWHPRFLRRLRQHLQEGGVAPGHTGPTA